MPLLRVPERYRVGISRIAQIDEGGFQQLLEALKKAPVLESASELTAWVANEIPSLSAQDQRSILQALISLFRVQKGSGVDTLEFTKDVWESLFETSPSLFNVRDERLLKSRLSALIEQSALDLSSSKITDVRGEVERSYCGARILTDLRPAFKDDATVVPTAMALLHTLQLGYHDGMGKHHEFYVTLDGEDLISLKKALERAEAKSKTLNRAMNKSGINIS